MDRLVHDVYSVNQSLSPKVLMVEEAGQVLEVHVLGTLVQSVEHLILIGDPLQLRPTLNNFCMLRCGVYIRTLLDLAFSAIHGLLAW